MISARDPLALWWSTLPLLGCNVLLPFRCSELEMRNPFKRKGWTTCDKGKTESCRDPPCVHHPELPEATGAHSVVAAAWAPSQSSPHSHSGVCLSPWLYVCTGVHIPPCLDLLAGFSGRLMFGICCSQKDQRNLAHDF